MPHEQLARLAEEVARKLNQVGQSSLPGMGSTLRQPAASHLSFRRRRSINSEMSHGPQIRIAGYSTRLKPCAISTTWATRQAAACAAPSW